MKLTIEGTPILWRAIRQAWSIFGYDRTILAIPAADQKHFGFVLREAVAPKSCLYLGDENDVLGRFYSCAINAGVTDPSTPIVRWTPDDWRKDSKCIRQVVHDHLHGHSPNYLSVEQSVEIFSWQKLCEWHWSIEGPNTREHMGVLMDRPAIPPDDGLPWSVDTPQDYLTISLKVGP